MKNVVQTVSGDQFVNEKLTKWIYDIDSSNYRNKNNICGISLTETEFQELLSLLNASG